MSCVGAIAMTPSPREVDRGRIEACEPAHWPLKHERSVCDFFVMRTLADGFLLGKPIQPCTLSLSVVPLCLLTCSISPKSAITLYAAKRHCASCAALFGFLTRKQNYGLMESRRVAQLMRKRRECLPSNI